MYYKDHSADWWRRNGVGIYYVPFIFLLLYGLVLLFLHFETISNIDAAIGVACFFIAAICIPMIIHFAACRIYMYNALAAIKGGSDIEQYEKSNLYARMFWAWVIDAVGVMLFYGIGFSKYYICLAFGLPIIAVILIVSLAFAIVHTKKSKVKSEGKDISGKE